ncbi:hypothetical protein FA13DRAFT_1756107 [Coprinellus micaceus]|uniref:Uncharacterized protein n=1 Tax=Coprinellus micaceus TaxID=71717 RepID=A0A4Y7T0G7_COPMI|nr:hypothetical protein FA13DRAFT_1756107 [Coprinellus micaceus]
MYSTLITAVALFAVPVLRVAAFAVSEPELTQCESAKISWQGTTGPYNVILVDAAEPCGEPLAEVGDFDKTFVNWKVAIPAGKVVQISIADSKDDEAWSGNITVKASSDSSCLTGAPLRPTRSPAAQLPPPPPTPDDSTADDSTTEVKPVGAANAGSNSFLNAAPAARNINGPVLALSAIAAVVALAL